MAVAVVVAVAMAEGGSGGKVALVELREEKHMRSVFPCGRYGGRGLLSSQAAAVEGCCQSGSSSGGALECVCVRLCMEGCVCGRFFASRVHTLNAMRQAALVSRSNTSMPPGG